MTAKSMRKVDLKYTTGHPRTMRIHCHKLQNEDVATDL